MYMRSFYWPMIMANIIAIAKRSLRVRFAWWTFITVLFQRNFQTLSDLLHCLDHFRMFGHVIGGGFNDIGCGQFAGFRVFQIAL